MFLNALRFLNFVFYYTLNFLDILILGVHRWSLGYFACLGFNFKFYIFCDLFGMLVSNPQNVSSNPLKKGYTIIFKEKERKVKGNTSNMHDIFAHVHMFSSGIKYFAFAFVFLYLNYLEQISYITLAIWYSLNFKSQ